MIATHNSMSYLPFESFWYKLKSKRYRCQDRTIDEQIKDGVKYFDIRIKYDGNWFFAHAGADFKSPQLDEILSKINKNGGYFRLIYEGSDDTDKILFKQCLYPGIKKRYPDALDQVVIKERWIEIKPSRFKFVDRSYVPIHSDSKVTFKQKFERTFANIKKWAKEHNVSPTKEEFNDKNTVYFYDFYEL